MNKGEDVFLAFIGTGIIVFIILVFIFGWVEGISLKVIGFFPLTREFMFNLAFIIATIASIIAGYYFYSKKEE